MDRSTNIRDITVKSSSGVIAADSSQLKGEAKNSLSGKNVTKGTETSVSLSGPWGGKNTGK